MAENQFGPSIQLFYSYSHKDAQYRELMEKSLSLLKKEKLLQQWSDREILPCRPISMRVREKIDQADIMVFLFSPDFIASEECTKEWEYAASLASNGKPLFRIPIILRECAWVDVLGNDDVKALPNDGKPVAHFDDKDTAWQQVYQGIKAVLNELRTTFTPKEEFLREVDKTDFMSQSHLKLQDLFVFLRLTCDDPQGSDQSFRDITISNKAELLTNKRVLIHGQEKVGKTALARHLYLSLIEESQPVLLVDLAQSDGKLNEMFLRDAYHAQFHGDYSLWVQQDNKTLILDNMTSAVRSFELVEKAQDTFDRIIVTLSSDVFYSYFHDEERLANFRQMKMEPLTRTQQEELIRKRLAMSDVSQPITDGFVDQIEGHVNSVIVSNKIVPRYPFYVLSILQTYEAYMPTNISITSYGHCYYVLIVANLMRSGISKADDNVNACFNFAEHLAFEIYRHREQRTDVSFDFNVFLTKYKERFIITDAVVNRLKDLSYGLIGEDGTFKTEYMYYFFLGKFLAGNSEEGKPVISAMCESSYREANYLTLLFTIHHTRDNSIIDDILIRTMYALDSVHPAVLDSDETKRFGSFLNELPENIQSDDSVKEARQKERAGQDDLDDSQIDTQNEPEDLNPVNGIYKILRNNKIMGQVLRNKHGNLEISKIEEIVQIIADSGLRLVNLVLEDEEEIARAARYLQSKNPDWDTARLKQALQFVSFIWTMVNVEQIVEAINVPEIRGAVNTVVNRSSTPAFDLIGYFSQLDNARVLTSTERNKLADLLKKHDDIFVQRVLSLRTQHYMNTHRSPTQVEQAICSLLNIKYSPRLVSGF